MKAMIPRLLAALLLWTSLSDVAVAEPRIALVIANADYEGSLPPLANPANDGKLIAQRLKSVGFQVTLLTDASQKEMKLAVRKFGDALAAAGSTATGLFYFAGHGLQVGGVNYLVPVGAEIDREGDVDLESVAADTVLRQMESAGASTSIVILDACRNNPLSRGFRSATRGLARMDAPNGSFVAYSTAPGDVAADGTGKNSPFALALAEEMVKPGQGIESTFRNVRLQVMTATEQQQVPWDSSSMVFPFYFNGDKEVAHVAAAPTTPQPTPAAVPEPVMPAQEGQVAALDANREFQSPLPDGTIVLSPAVKVELDAYLAKVATMETAMGSYKWAFFYVSEDGRHAGSYSCRAELAENGDCPTTDMNTGSTGQSRERAKRACEMKAGTKCVYLFRADEAKAAYQLLN